MRWKPHRESRPTLLSLPYAWRISELWQVKEAACEREVLRRAYKILTPSSSTWVPSLLQLTSLYVFIFFIIIIIFEVGSASFLSFTGEWGPMIHGVQ